MHHRLAAGDRDDGRSEVGQFIQPLFNDIDVDRLLRVIVFVAIATGEIAAPHRNQMGQNGMLRGQQRATDKTGLTQLQF
jgi:hypothetical protein